MIDRTADVYALDQQGGKGGANYMVNTMCTILSDSHGTPHAIAYKVVDAYGFDSYNQYCWPEIEPTIRSHGGGDSVPKCFVRKKHDSEPLGCPEQTHQHNGRNTSCDICRAKRMDGI